MVAKGDQYVVPYVPTPYVFSSFTNLTVESASQQGYRALLGHTPESDAIDAQIGALNQSMTEVELDKYVNDLTGGENGPKGSVEIAGSKIIFPMSGCQYEAQFKLYGDVTAWNQAELTVSRASFQIFGIVEGQKRVADLNAQWSDCMKVKNRVYAQPGDAFDAGLKMSSGPDGSYIGPTEPEVALAVADANCRVSTGYDAALTEITNAALSQYARDNEGEVLKLIEIDRAAQQTAAKLIG